MRWERSAHAKVTTLGASSTAVTSEPPGPRPVRVNASTCPPGARSGIWRVGALATHGRAKANQATSATARAAIASRAHPVAGGHLAETAVRCFVVFIAVLTRLFR